MTMTDIYWSVFLWHLPNVLGKQLAKICLIVGSLIMSPISMITRSIVVELKSRSDGCGRASGTSDPGYGSLNKAWEKSILLIIAAINEHIQYYIVVLIYNYN